MSATTSLPLWATDLVAETSAAADQLNVIVGKINSISDISSQRALYVKLVREFVEIREIVSRFKFFVRINGLDDFEGKLASAGTRLGLRFEELACTFPRTKNVLFVDTESTGLGDSDEAITIAAVLMAVDCERGRIRREFHSYYGEREPLCGITAGAARVHGVSAVQLAGKRFDLREIVALFGVADLVVAHNAEFDKRMLRFVDSGKYNWQCSCHGIAWPEDACGRSLEALCGYFGVQRATPHNAKSDVRALISVLSQHKIGGQSYLLDLLRERAIAA